MTPKQFKTYLWMVDIIKNRPGITFSELREAWEKDMILGEKSSLDRRTFIRYRNELEFLFGLDIICDIRNGYGYYLGNEHVINDNSGGGGNNELPKKKDNEDELSFARRCHQMA